MDEVLYAERGSWRPLWIVLGLLAVGVLLDAVLPGSGPHWLGWLVVSMILLGLVAVVLKARHGLTTIELTPHILSVGSERVALSTVASVSSAGAPLGARVLGGALQVPKGCAPVPLTLTDGATVLVPTRDVDAFRAALANALP